MIRALLLTCILGIAATVSAQNWAPSGGGFQTTVPAGFPAFALPVARSTQLNSPVGYYFYRTQPFKPIGLRVIVGPVVSSPKPSDQFEIAVRVHEPERGYEGFGDEYRFALNVPDQGKSGAQWCYLPACPSGVFQFSILKNGQPLPEFTAMGAINGSSTTPVLHVTSEPQAVKSNSTLRMNQAGLIGPAVMFPIETASPVIGQSMNFAGGMNPSNHRSLTTLTAGELFDRWEGYRTFEMLILSADVLTQLEQSDRQRFTALKQWVLQGGKLAVYGKTVRNTLDEMFVKVDPVVAEQVARQRFRDAQSRFASMGVDLTSKTISLGNIIEPTTGTGKALVRALTDEEAAFYSTSSEDEFLELYQQRDFGLGNIVAIQVDAPEQATWSVWASVDAKVLPMAGVVSQVPRFGTSLDPKLSTTPLTMFWVLMTIFVIVAGPVLYFWSRRGNALYRIFLFVPPLAIGLLLFTLSWVTISEGWGVRESVTRLTFVDRDLGRSTVTTETILNPTADLVPLKAPSVEHVIERPSVMPFHPDIYGGYQYFLNNFQMDRVNEKVLSTYRDAEGEKGWIEPHLPVREQTPYVVYDVKLDKRHLALITGKPPKLRNRLGIGLTAIVFQDEAGGYWQVNELADGAEGTATSINRDQFLKECRRLAEKIPLIRGEGYAFQRSYAFGIDFITTRGVDQSGSLTDATRAEYELGQMRLGGVLPKYFLAESPDPIEDLLVPDSQLMNQTHVIMGQLK